MREVKWIVESRSKRYNTKWREIERFDSLDLARLNAERDRRGSGREYRILKSIKTQVCHYPTKETES